MKSAIRDHLSVVTSAMNYELVGPRELGFQYFSLIDTEDNFPPNLVTTKGFLCIRFEPTLIVLF